MSDPFDRRRSDLVRFAPDSRLHRRRDIDGVGDPRLPGAGRHLDQGRPRGLHDHADTSPIPTSGAGGGACTWKEDSGELEPGSSPTPAIWPWSNCGRPGGWPDASPRTSMDCISRPGLPPEAVAELHGNVREVRCLDCDHRWPTEEILQRVEAGEEEPRCEFLRRDRENNDGHVRRATSGRRAGTRLGDGGRGRRRPRYRSTLGVWPAAEIPYTAAQEGRPLVIVNQGPTEMDHLASVRIEGAAGVGAAGSGRGNSPEPTPGATYRPFATVWTYDR